MCVCLCSLEWLPVADGHYLTNCLYMTLFSPQLQCQRFGQVQRINLHLPLSLSSFLIFVLVTTSYVVLKSFASLDFSALCFIGSLLVCWSSSVSPVSLQSPLHLESHLAAIKPLHPASEFAGRKLTLFQLYICLYSLFRRYDVPGPSLS